MSTDTSDNAAPFRTMAAKIDLNRDNGFAGAFVIVPPAQDGAGSEPQAALILDESHDEAVFWSMIMTKCQIALKDIEDRERQGQFGGRR
jgi:hypothetical protein